MILKSYELSKKDTSGLNLFIVYGENTGLKKEIINTIKKKFVGKEIKYDESDLIKNKLQFFNEFRNRSLFDEQKIYIIDRCSDKISEIIFILHENEINDPIIINCGTLEKKSKLRNLIEKSKKAIIVPTYKDNTESLIDISKKFFSEKKISVSYETLNLLANRCNGDRGHLKYELDKISNYLSDKKVISLKEISTLTNLSQNYSAAELVDASLSKNIKRTREILNENNYSQEDTFLILRVFLQKAKKILSLLENMKDEKDIEKVIAEHKPPIFWKEKPIVVKQLKLWSFFSIREVIYNLNDLEIKIKKNNNLGLILLSNFIYEVLDKDISNSSLSSQ
tara:strand:- start:1258 stop:2268 length:1011 start_codon:yes stop_codon:yes gene_type:complete